jgi:ParB-like chromosome segregation protein Spo0J
MEFHEVAGIFPMMDAGAFSELKEDIRQSGLLEPIYLLDGKILDGRNRYRACTELGIEPTTREWRGSDPVKFVVSMNLKRRHLKESQRGMVAARIANLPKHVHKTPDGPIGPSPSAPQVSQSDAARTMNVSRSTVKRAKVVLEAGPKELVEQVERGETTVNAAVGKLIEAGTLDRKAPLTTRKRKQDIQNAQKDTMIRGLSTITGICRGLADMNVSAALRACSREEIFQWSEKASGLSVQLRNFSKKLLSEGRDEVNGKTTAA